VQPDDFPLPSSCLHLRQHCLHLRHPEGHRHRTIHLNGGGELDASLLHLAELRIQGAVVF